MSDEWTNKLYFGDNLDVLREHVPDESVDLVYLDPPFNSKATYNVLFAEKNGTESAAQITAFEDTWHWGMESEEAYHEVVADGPEQLGDLLQAFLMFLGRNDLMAYLTMMAVRLVELQRALKPTGTIYLHCDPTASHYLKLVMDAIFRHRNFQNDISWRRTTTKADYREGATNWPRVHDVLLHYAKDVAQVATFRQPFAPYSEEYVATKYRYTDADDRRYRLDNLTAPGAGSRGHPQYEFMGVTRYWRYNQEKMEALLTEGRIAQTKPGNVPQYKRYLDEMPGIAVGDMWEDVKPINAMARERLGYPTQKPEGVLERIIEASSNEGDVVLDPFCGCGTTVAVAEGLGRHWIGIDLTHLAITLMRHRLYDTFGDDLAPYDVIGLPMDVASAEALALENRYQFEWWALGLVDARPAQDKKKGADSGIDGFINFFDDNSGKAKRLIVQVKSGKVSVSQIRDLKGVLDREKAPIGGFITLQRPTKPMLKEAASAGFHETPDLPDSRRQTRRYPRIQVLAIEEILDGNGFDYPPLRPSVFRRAQRRTKRRTGQREMFEED